MDKFTKTTEMDISAINDIDEKSPKKNKLGSIISIIFCLLIAVIIWLYVMENDTTEYTREYYNVSVNVVGGDGYKIEGELCVDVVIEGVNKDLVDIDKNDIYVTLDINKIKDTISSGEAYYPVAISISSDDYGDRIKFKDTNVKLIISEKPWKL